MEYLHVPVLSNEILELLQPEAGDVIVDGTLGGGGHSLELAKRIGGTGILVGIDLDPAAIAKATALFAEAGISCDYRFVRGNYADIGTICAEQGLVGKRRPTKILADFGISSYDLEGSNRGFTFQRDEPLDMRFDPDSVQDEDDRPRNAAFLVNTMSAKDLENIFREYAEERFSRQIANAIVEARETAGISTSAELLAIITGSLPKKFQFTAPSVARRIFQALRIEVNGELDNVRTFLPAAFDLLAPNGRLAAISFHSLEDRIVKQYIADLAKGCICPPDFPLCVCGKEPPAKPLTKKPVTASEDEAAKNPRSKPAKLRAFQKI